MLRHPGMDLSRSSETSASEDPVYAGRSLAQRQVLNQVFNDDQTPLAHSISDVSRSENSQDVSASDHLTPTRNHTVNRTATLRRYEDRLLMMSAAQTPEQKEASEASGESAKGGFQVREHLNLQEISATLTPLQATVEFSIELRNLYNVDLFDKGHYHVRVSVLESNNLTNDSPPLSTSDANDNLNMPTATPDQTTSVPDASKNANAQSSMFFSKSSDQTPNYQNGQTAGVHLGYSSPFQRFHSEVIGVRNHTVLLPKKASVITPSSPGAITQKEASVSSDDGVPDHLKTLKPTATSKECTVNFKRESVSLEQIYLFRVHRLVSCPSIDQELSAWQVPFLFELWWEEDDRGEARVNSFPQRVSQRIVNITWNAKTGVHDYGLCIFEYGYSAAVEFVVHGSLTALHQPYKNIIKVLMGPEASQPELEDILFTGLAGRAGQMESMSEMDSHQVISTANSAQAKIIHHLNQAHEILAYYLREPPDRVAIHFKEKIDTVSRCTGVQEAIGQINMNLASVCSDLLGRWTSCQDAWAMSKEYYEKFKHEYHLRKLERFNRGQFILKNQMNGDGFRSDCLFDKETVFAKMAANLRSSTYFREMPDIAIKCQEIDVSSDLHVILVEDRYVKKSQSAGNMLEPSLSHRASSDSINSLAMDVSERKVDALQNALEGIGLEDVAICTASACGRLARPPSNSTPAADEPSNVSLIKVKKLNDERLSHSTTFEWGRDDTDTDEDMPIRCHSVADGGLGKSVDNLTAAFCMPRYFRAQPDERYGKRGLAYAPGDRSTSRAPFTKWALASEVYPIFGPQGERKIPKRMALPYFPYRELHVTDPVHLIVCVHGLEGSPSDLRLIRSWIERTTLNRKIRICWLMSSANTDDTFEDIGVQGKRLATEVHEHIELLKIQRRSPSKISMIGHSMGALVAKAAVAHPKFDSYRSLLHTYLSLSGPHLGLKYNTSTTHSLGLWFLQKFKRSVSLQQLQLKDHAISKAELPYVYKLLRLPSLQYFKNVIFVSCAGDKYVPFHSARIELSKDAFNDKSDNGLIHRESIKQVERSILESKQDTQVYRYHVQQVHQNTPGATAFENTVINFTGRAPHILTLENEHFMEKFMLGGASRFFI